MLARHIDKEIFFNGSTMSYTYLGNIANIPDYTTWSEPRVAPNRIVDSPEFLQQAKIHARRSVADQLVKEFGYPEPTVVGADPEDFSKWAITNSTVTDRIGALLGFDQPNGRVQVMAPGAMVPLHLDNLRLGYIDGNDQVVQKVEFTQQQRDLMNADPTSVSRVLIMLEDWKHGQAVLFGDQWFDHWRAGDVVGWNWLTGIHATVNCGYWSRALLRLSGLVTDRFRQISVPFELNYQSSQPTC
jgi:hypothetical protein